MTAEVITVNRYVLRDAGGFDHAVVALAARVKTEGHPGIRAYRFYRPTAGEGRAVVTYASPEAWVGHHELIMGWPEMAALRASGDLAEVMLFGKITPPMQDWIIRMGLEDRVRSMGQPRAGFLRDEV